LSILSHIIPNSIASKVISIFSSCEFSKLTLFQPATLACILVFAGEKTQQLVFKHLNRPGNLMILVDGASSKCDCLAWGIEAKEAGDEVRRSLIEDADAHRNLISRQHMCFAAFHTPQHLGQCM